MTLRRRTLPLAAVLFLTAFPRPTPNTAPACAVAPPLNGHVSIFDETAIILWDAATKTEHFIRKANFHATGVKDFGFIVPTPSKPTLTEADDKVFSEFARITAPKIVTKTRPAPSSSGGCGCSKNAAFMMPNAAAPEPKVSVLDEVQVAGYDAAVLEADNADVLGKWLTDHGYAFSPTLKDWAESYIKMKWKFTAFKIAKSTADKSTVATGTVRMSFATDRPFYPYREPTPAAIASSGPGGGRVLRVYFVGEKIVDGAIGEKKAVWPAYVPWAGEIAAADRDKVLQLLKLPAATTPEKWWLTEFEDRSSPRPASDDVFYHTSDNQTPRERPAQVHYVSNNLPGALMFCMVGLYLAAPCLWRRLRK